MLMIVIRKEAVSLLFALLMSISLAGGTAIAAENDSVHVLSGNYSVLWVNTASISMSLSFDGSEALCGACVIGVTGTTEIIGTAMLARKNLNGTYTTVKTWSNLSATDDILVFDDSWYVTTGYTYDLPSARRFIGTVQAKRCPDIMRLRRNHKFNTI